MLETSDVSRDADETSSTFSRSAGGGWFSLGSSVTWGSFSAAAGAAAGAAGGDGDAPRRGRVERCCSVSSTDLTDDSSSLDEAAVRLLPRRCCCCCCCCSCGCASTAAVVAEAAAAERVEGISGGAVTKRPPFSAVCSPDMGTFGSPSSRCLLSPLPLSLLWLALFCFPPLQPSRASAVLLSSCGCPPCTACADATYAHVSGAFFSSLLARVWGDKELRILILGLDGAGKTTILYRLQV